MIEIFKIMAGIYDNEVTPIERDKTTSIYNVSTRVLSKK